MTHLHSVYDNDTHFKIDPETRQIKNESGKVILMQNDHNSERLTFEIPRHIDGHDMSTCNKVEVHYINLKADKTEKSANVYPVEDLQISPASEDVVICSWLISQNATKYAGSLNFVLRYACLTGNTIDYQWYTDIHKGISVSESISNTKTVAIDYSDILEKWRLEVLAKEGPSDEQIAKAVSDYMTEEVNLVKTVNGVQPDEDGDVKVETSGFSIINNASGEVISVSNSSDSELQGLKLYGKTVQNGTPTPDAPVPLETVGADGNVAVKITNGNLLTLPYVSPSPKEQNGLTFVTNDDGSVTVNGTATKETMFYCTDSVYPLYLPKGVYHFSGVPAGTYGGSVRPQLYITRKGGGHSFAVYAEGRAVELTEPGYYTVTIDIVAGNTLTDFVIKPMVNVGNTALPFETPASAQTLTTQTPNGLPGIPVSSGGNYTDENGQQWICDEVDFEKGVYIQRVDTILLDGVANRFTFKSTATNTNSYRIAANDSKIFMLRTGGNEEKPAILSNRFTAISYNERNSGAVGININTQTQSENTIWCTFGANNPATLAESNAWLAENNTTVMYALETPIETALSADELAQYTALHTNYPNTTIYNDYGAEMEVGYISQDAKPVFDWLKGEISNSNQQVTKAAPRNLLDNSDFRNPVAQAGIDGRHGEEKYVIDRWRHLYTLGTVEQTSNGLKISGADFYMQQRFDATHLIGKTLTAAVCTSDGLILCVSFVLENLGELRAIGGEVGLYIMIADYGLAIRLDGAYEHTLVWAALYEGEYTAETLPEYQPKGYGAELLECMRYFYRFNYSVNGMYSPCLAGATQIPGFLFPVTMRKVPTMIIDVLKTWTTDGITDVTGAVSSYRCTVGGLQYIELTTAATKNGLVNLTADFVADLP